MNLVILLTFFIFSSFFLVRCWSDIVSSIDVLPYCRQASIPVLSDLRSKASAFKCESLNGWLFVAQSRHNGYTDLDEIWHRQSGMTQMLFFQRVSFLAMIYDDDVGNAAESSFFLRTVIYFYSGLRFIKAHQWKIVMSFSFIYLLRFSSQKSYNSAILKCFIWLRMFLYTLPMKTLEYSVLFLLAKHQLLL